MSATPWPDEVELSSPHATLVPLRAAHAPALAIAAADGDLWRHWYTNIPAPADMETGIAERLARRAAGECLPFAVLTPDGSVVGMTSYWNIDARNARVEIGGTWYAARVQRSAVNTACKRMLLAHAFEVLDCIAVEFRTHFFNHQSRQAIERLGAKLDGVLRNHSRGRDGLLRDTCVYSIIAGEWPTVRHHLDYRLARHGDRSGRANG
ncbi:MAG: GNAT family N-acetyltransferase [Alphaproteobacteria bacterium]|nr:GNAT family N-acetyltransferase [Alphaproteobacteria bacterium]